MDKAQVLSTIRTVGLIPVLRASSESEALALAAALAAGGVTVLEVTMTVPKAVDLIARLVLEKGKDLLIGAGTVLSLEAAQQCLDAGAQFVVSPGLKLSVVEFCRRRDIAVFPGGLTPTEVLTAWEAGADAVKIFPASAMGGAKYLKALKAPFPQIEMIPTGGVSLATARDFLDAGAIALGVGADLVDPKAIQAGTPEIIRDNARSYLEIVRAFQAKTA
jgi:2-dehydro-3-deoxyphosphogluconate aldolase / (4S)-4-hydroxy-2-oxoglutarate aldolase